MEDIDGSFKLNHPGGLSILSMDFTCKGLSWAGNIYQKWENISLDNILAQKQCKYIGVLGEHFRKILDEVADDWLNHSNGRFQGPVSDLSLEHHIISSEESYVSSVEDSQRETLVNESSKGGNTSKGSLPSCNESCTSDLTSFEALEGESNTSFMRPIDEGAAMTRDDIDLSMETIEGFEDINIKDFYGDIENSEKLLILQQPQKKISYKRKLKHVFSSRITSSKTDRNYMKDDLISAYTMKQIEFETIPSPTKASSDSDWELL